ncbi:MAG: BamA/TamA family outer membrane protein [Proteobacteria bacterium]|nr:BamA/TamA family outer membrane protein [Pseudomonadota bacterium]
MPAIIANPPELHPDLPPADWPGFTLAWPDPAAAPAPLAALPPEPGLPTATPEELVPNRAGAQYAFAGGHLALAWAPGDPPPSARAALESRFRPLSALLSLSGKEAAGLGQVAVRAATDRDLLLRMLRTEGYYDAEVDQALAAAPASAAPGPAAPPPAIAVRFDLLPGTRYRFGKVALPGLEAAGADAAELRAAFPVASGDPVISGAVVEARATLDTALGEGGYPFARVAEGELVVDHRSEQADLSVPVTPGGKYRFGTLTSNLPRFLSSRHLADIARFHPGDPYRRSEVDDLRRAILATGLVSSVTVTPREAQAPAADQPGTVGLDVALAPAPLRTVAGAVGYDTGDGFRLEASWEHRNLVPPEGMLRLRAVAGTNEQLAGATLRQNNFLGRDRALTVDIYADNANRSAYAARKLAFATTFERLTTLLFQKPWTWSMSLEVEASAEREGVPSGITTGRTNYLTVALPLRVAFDTSDDLLDPTRGWRLSARASPETAYSHGQWATYAKLQFDGSAYLPLADRVVLAGRVRLGSIPGAALSQIAPSRRFYAGGGGSVRGYGYQLIGPRNSNGDITGGRSLYEASVEARIKTGLFAGTLSLAPFLDAGGVDSGDVPGFHDTRFGAGVGLRWQTGFGPLRVDLGTPIGRRPGESVIGVYVALGQSF